MLLYFMLSLASQCCLIKTFHLQKINKSGKNQNSAIYSASTHHSNVEVCSNSTVVDHSSQYPLVEGSSPTTAA
jgi:hypothetical protein